MSARSRFGSIIDSEDQPLLSASPNLSTGCNGPTRDVPRDTSASLGDESNDPLAADGADAATTRSWPTIAFQGVLVVLSLVVVGVCIRGVMDADNIEFDLGKALNSALGGGLSGAIAMVLQVLTLMPLRTVMSYQYRYGTTITETINTLYADGGWTRYYHGLPAALVLAASVRFVSTASNVGVLALLQSNSFTRKLPMLIKTLFASVVATDFRMLVAPIDTIKTAMQTQGKSGIPLLRARVKKYGIGSLWYGALATAAVSLVGNYPWFATYNYLDATLPLPTTLLSKLLRSALMGFTAAIIADIISNPLHVVKTYRQVNATRIGYVDAARAVIAVDGVQGLFGRGLKTRILTNGLQSILFSVMWKLLLDLWNERTSESG